MEPSAWGIANDAGQQLYGRFVGMRRGRHVVADEDDLGIAHAPNRQGAFAILGWFECVGRLQHAGGFRDGAEILVNHLQGLFFIELPGHEQHGVVRLVILPVERLQPLDGDVFNVRPRANRRVAVVVPVVGHRMRALQQHPVGTVFPGLKLVAHDGHFRIEVFLGNEAVHHAVGFQIERPPEVVLGCLKGLEVVGAIKPGGPVRARATLGQFLGNVRVAWGALEHKVFQQVRHAGFAVVFMTRTDQIGDVDGDGLLGFVGEEQHPQPVFQTVLGDAFHTRDARDARRQGDGFGRRVGLDDHKQQGTWQAQGGCQTNTGQPTQKGELHKAGNLGQKG